VIISGLDLVVGAGLARVEAEITWEATNEGLFKLFAEAPEEVGDALWPDPNALVTACILPAWRANERRVRFEEPLCPVLRCNLEVAIATLKSWYPDLGQPPVIESSIGSRVLCPSQTHALSLLSCGVDSLAILRWNTLHVPRAHPAAIRGVASVLFHEDPSASRSEFEARLSPAMVAIRPVAEDVGVEILPVVTNLWWLVNNGYFYDEKWHGAVLSAMASLFSRRYDQAYVASSEAAEKLHPWGSHPMLDHHYSSAHFRIEHHGLSMTRFEKVSLVGNWPVGLQNLRVCQRGASWQGNCGICEKCIRTMTALVALGKLEGCRAFPRQDVSSSLLAGVGQYMRAPYMDYEYTELIPALDARGRGDLARTIEDLLAIED
jgi:hypothetical protein